MRIFVPILLLALMLSLSVAPLHAAHKNNKPRKQKHQPGKVTLPSDIRDPGLQNQPKPKRSRSKKSDKIRIPQDIPNWDQLTPKEQEQTIRLIRELQGMAPEDE